jgi:two-component system NtrC family sensor kinase
MKDIPALPQTTQARDYPYFRRLWNTTVMTLLAASFIPYLFIGGIIYAYTASVLKEKTLEILESEVLQQKTVIDRFLAERTRELQLICNNGGLSLLTQPGALDEVFKTLSKASPYFIDLGIIDDRGKHIAYVGPYDLLSKNYQTSDWYIDTLAHDVYISDIFLGFRNIPHSVIAVKYAADDGEWIVRATIDGSYFDKIVKEISYQKEGDAYLVNPSGIYQTTPRKSGKVMARSDMMHIPHHDGVKFEEHGNLLRLSVWLEQVPWVSVVEINKNEAFGSLYRVRNLVIYIFIVSAIIMIFAILLTTNYLLTRLESKRKSIRHLDQQLRHTSRIATSATLSTGVFHKVKDCLANIDVTAQCIAESPQSDTTAPFPDDAFQNSLRQIHDQVLDARNAIDKYLRITDASGPMIKGIEINRLLSDLIELLDWEVQHKQATILKAFDDDLVNFRSDPTTVRHILQNLIHNAIEAIPQHGQITIRTRGEKEGVRITVSDNGPGISEADRQRIFEPLFSTKARSLGLGLSVSKSIIEKLGGSLSLESSPGEGAAFTAFFPYRIPHDQT